MATFHLSLWEVDQFEWEDMVRWHVQAQRIQGEEADIAIAKSQLDQLSAVAQGFRDTANG